ncbi:hypothetical protein EDB81DRAFT_140310 [Dactylonectria macrodidyma]|uniref:Uncharacterized protein n=1 Tax=Dactylonectria macrodidyma TaxID=307937 RepID=A0A9P9E1C1_9HYPO|nr:hypothetical protein EDB81DRAFT_140310 [Dactylonectria macrodidyma]
MESLFKTLQDKKLGKSRNTWYIKTGTVIRCDVDSDGKTNASALFVSIPQLQVDSFNRTTNVQLRKGICLPRRLHEMFHPYDTSLTRDKNQLFRSHEGAQSDEVLWIGDTWVLIIDSVGILTYGSKHRQTYLSDNIEIRDHLSSQVEERTIHVTHPDGQQFQIPFEACQTLYKLQSAIRDQLSILEDDDSILDFELVITGGEVVTAKSWSRLVQKPEQSVIKLVVEWVVPDESESDRDSIKPNSQEDEMSHISGDIETDKQDAASKNGILSGKRSRSVSRQRTTVPFADDDFFGIQQQSSTTKDEDSDLDIPELNAKVPPFLGWTILEISKEDDDDNKTNDEGSTIRESIRVCLSRAETALKDGQHPFVAKLKDNFSTLDLPSISDDVNFNVIEKRILQLAKQDSKNGRGRKLRFGKDKIASLYKGFLSASIRTLEAYTFKEFPSPIISSYYTALLNGLESPKPPPNNHYPVRWVLSREPIPIAGFKYLNTTLDGIKCPDCNSQKIYDNIESAIDHLRKRHCAGSTPGTRLVEYLTPLSEAQDSRLEEECSEVLRTCRDTMVHITRRLRDIQDAMVFDGQFQKPAQGIPFALLKSLELIVAFVCAVPMLLDEIYWFYNYEIDEQKLGNLVLDGKIREKYQLLKDVGHAAETLTKDAERALVSSIHSKRKEDVVKFFTSVGSHCVATQIICNLLRHPIQNNAKVAELYQAYCTDYGSQVFRHPSKRQIPAIGAMADELARLRTVTEWQQKLVSSLRTVLSPETHRESAKGVREKTFPIEDYILDKTDEELQEQFDMISSSLDQCKDLLESVNELMEIMSDNHNRAILVFTVVTVVFLPMSFIATYLSMNGGPSEDHWGKTQALFWEISAPLALGIGIFCLGTAWHGSEVGAVREWISKFANRWRNKLGRRNPETDSSGYLSSSDYEETESGRECSGV